MATLTITIDRKNMKVIEKKVVDSDFRPNRIEFISYLAHSIMQKSDFQTFYNSEEKNYEKP